MDLALPRASISVFAGRELAFVSTGNARFELRANGIVVGTLESPRDGLGRAAAVDGRWWFSNPRGSRIEAGREGSNSVIARYWPSTVGGRLRLDDGRRYALRPPVIGDRFKLRTRTQRLVADVRRSHFHTVRLAPRADEEEQLSLLILLALQALLVEELMPVAAGGGGPS